MSTTPTSGSSGNPSLPLTLLHSFPPHVARSMALPLILHLDGAGAAMGVGTPTQPQQTTAASPGATQSQPSWSNEHTAWSMECIGFAFTLPLLASTAASSSQQFSPTGHYGGVAGLGAATPAAAAAEDNIALMHCSVSIYTRWMLSGTTNIGGKVSPSGTGTGAPAAPVPPPAFLQKMTRHLAALFEQRGGGGALISPGGIASAFASAPLSASSSYAPSVHLAQSPSFAGLAGGDGRRAPGADASFHVGSVPSGVGLAQQSYGAGGLASHSHAHSHSSGSSASAAAAVALQALDARIIALAVRVLQLFLAVGRAYGENSSGCSMDAATWRVLLQSMLRVTDSVLSRGSRCPGGVTAAAAHVLEPLCVRTLFDLWLRSQCMDADLWSALSSLARRRVHSRWMMRCWRVAAGMLSAGMWRVLFCQAPPSSSSTSSPAATPPSRLVFQWPAATDLPMFNEQPSSPASATSAASSIGWPSAAPASASAAATAAAQNLSTSVAFAQSRTLVFFWHQMLHMYGRSAVLDLLVVREQPSPSPAPAPTSATRPLGNPTRAAPMPMSVAGAGGAGLGAAASAYHAHGLSGGGGALAGVSGALAAAGIGVSGAALAASVGKRMDRSAEPSVAAAAAAAAAASASALSHRDALAASASASALAAEAALQSERAADRAERAEVYRVYVEGICAMVDTFLQRPPRILASPSASASVAGGSAAAAAAGSTAPPRARMLPQNLNFVLSTFGSLLFEVGESSAPAPGPGPGPSPSAGGTSSPDGGGASASSGELDGFEVGRSLAVGCLLRVFTSKAYSAEPYPSPSPASSPTPSAAASASALAGAPDPPLSLAHLSRFYSLLQMLLLHTYSGASGHVVVQAVFAHSGRLFSRGLPGAHTLLPAFWTHLRNFLSQTAVAPTAEGQGQAQGSVGSPLAAASAGGGGGGAGASAQQKRYQVLTRIRRNCVRMLSSAVALASCAAHDAARVMALQQLQQQQAEASAAATTVLPTVAAGVGGAAGMGIGAALIVAPTPAASISASVSPTHAAGTSGMHPGQSLSPFASPSTGPSVSTTPTTIAGGPHTLVHFLQHHSLSVCASHAFFRAAYSSFPHVLLNSLFSESEPANLHGILWALVGYFNEERISVEMHAAAAAAAADARQGGEGSTAAIAAAEAMSRGLSGDTSSSTYPGCFRTSPSASLSTFPHLALTTLWKLLTEDTWPAPAALSALDALSALAPHHALCTAAEGHSVPAWLGQLVRFAERRLVSLVANVQSQQMQTPFQQHQQQQQQSKLDPRQAPFATVAGAGPDPFRQAVAAAAASGALSPTEAFAANKVLLRALQCLDAWVRHCPSVLGEAPPPAPAATHPRQAKGTRSRGAITASVPSSTSDDLPSPSSSHAHAPPALAHAATGSAELTRAITDLLLRGLCYSSSRTGPGDEYAHYQQREVQTQCLETLRFVLYDSVAASEAVARAARAGFGVGAGQEREKECERESAARHERQMSLLAASAHPRSPMPWIFRGLLAPTSTSTSACGAAVLPAPARGALLTEGLYVAHLVALGMLPRGATVERNVRWLLLRGNVLVSCIVYRPQGGGHGAQGGGGCGGGGGGGGGGKRLARPPRPMENESVAAPAGVVLFVRDCMGLAVFGARSILQPSPAATAAQRLALQQASTAGLSPSSLAGTSGGGGGGEAAHQLQPALAPDAPDDKFAQAILYLEQQEQALLAQEHAQALARSRQRQEREAKRKAEDEPSLAVPASGSGSTHSSAQSSPRARPLAGSDAPPDAYPYPAAASSDSNPLPTPQWLAVQREAETHRLYQKLMQQQQQLVAEDNDGPAPALRGDDATNDPGRVCCATLPPTATGAETVRALLSNLGWLAKLAPATAGGAAAAAAGPSVELLRSSAAMLAQVEQLDYGCGEGNGVSGSGGGANSSAPLHRVAILYRQRDQHSEAELYSNDTDYLTGGGGGGVHDPAFERLVSGLHAAAAGRLPHLPNIEYLIASRMHQRKARGGGGGTPARAEHTAAVRNFVQSHAALRVIFSRDPSDFVAAADFSPQSSAGSPSAAAPAAGGAGGPVVYIVIYPQCFDDTPAGGGGLDPDGEGEGRSGRACSPGVDPRLPSSYRVQVVCSAGAGGVAACHAVHTVHNEALQRLEDADALVTAQFVATVHPKDRARAEKEREAQAHAHAHTGAHTKFWKKYKASKSAGHAGASGTLGGKNSSVMFGFAAASEHESVLDALLQEEEAPLQSLTVTAGAGAGALAGAAAAAGAGAAAAPSSSAGSFSVPVPLSAPLHACLVGGPLQSPSLVEHLALPFLLHQTALHWAGQSAREARRAAAAAAALVAGPFAPAASFEPAYAQRQRLLASIAAAAPRLDALRPPPRAIGQSAQSPSSAAGAWQQADPVALDMDAQMFGADTRSALVQALFAVDA